DTPLSRTYVLIAARSHGASQPGRHRRRRRPFLVPDYRRCNYRTVTAVGCGPALSLAALPGDTASELGDGGVGASPGDVEGGGWSYQVGQGGVGIVSSSPSRGCARAMR